MAYDRPQSIAAGHMSLTRMPVHTYIGLTLSLDGRRNRMRSSCIHHYLEPSFFKVCV